MDTAFQQVKELENKVSGMEKRMVKAPEDMKIQMEKFFNASSYKLTHSIPITVANRVDYYSMSSWQVANDVVTSFKNSVNKLDEKVTQLAEYFCEDISQFKIEEIFSRLLKLVEQLPVLSNVSS